MLMVEGRIEVLLYMCATRHGRAVSSGGSLLTDLTRESIRVRSAMDRSCCLHGSSTEVGEQVVLASGRIKEPPISALAVQAIAPR
jgi:hypothetical protein